MSASEISKYETEVNNLLKKVYSCVPRNETEVQAEKDQHDALAKQYQILKTGLIAQGKKENICAQINRIRNCIAMHSQTFSSTSQIPKSTLPNVTVLKSLMTVDHGIGAAAILGGCVFGWQIALAGFAALGVKKAVQYCSRPRRASMTPMTTSKVLPKTKLVAPPLPATSGSIDLKAAVSEPSARFAEVLPKTKLVAPPLPAASGSIDLKAAVSRPSARFAQVVPKTKPVAPPLPATSGSIDLKVAVSGSSARFAEVVPKRLPSAKYEAFASIDSATLVPIPGSIQCREDFLRSSSHKTPPPVLVRSDFVPLAMTKHLMKNKKDIAIGLKYVRGDAITNMEGAMHTFLTPLCSVHMLGDYAWKKGHNIIRCNPGHARRVVMSAAIQPDFANDNVMLPLVSARQHSVQGKDWGDFPVPNPKEKPLFSGQMQTFFLESYEENLQRHMIYHLTEDHCLPSRSASQVFSWQSGKKYLESLIKSSNPINSSELKNKLITVNGHVISMEMMFNIYVEQLKNEFGGLERICPQGYVYTIDPPSIFAKALGGAEILNRFQALAFKWLNHNRSLSHLKCVGFNNYADPGCLEFFQDALGKIPVVPKRSLFQGPGGSYSGPQKHALVIHNNSDGFGQNIENQKATSLDGVVGCYSDAARVLDRRRTDLCSQVFSGNLKN